jgi:hypothetical protein
MPVLVERLVHNAARLLTHLLRGDAAYFRGKASQQSLFDIRVEVRFKLSPVDVLTSDDEIVEGSLFLTLSQILSHIFEVMQNLIIDATLSVSRIVSREPVATTTPGQGVEQGLALSEFIEVEIEEAGAMTIQNPDPQAGLASGENGG